MTGGTEESGKRKHARLKLDAAFTLLSDNSATGGLPLYIGEARPGVAEGAAKWRIKRFTYVSGIVTAIEWAGGNGDFDSTWTGRATHSYS